MPTPIYPDNYAARVEIALGGTPDSGVITDSTIDAVKEEVADNLEAKSPGLTSIPATLPPEPPDTEPIPNPARKYADRAIIYATALMLFDNYQRQMKKRESIPNATVEWYDIDWNALKADLQGKLDTAMGAADPAYAADSGAYFPGFRLTFSGHRKRCF
jgi:hypothetical protein